MVTLDDVLSAKDKFQSSVYLNWIESAEGETITGKDQPVEWLEQLVIKIENLPAEAGGDYNVDPESLEKKPAVTESDQVKSDKVLISVRPTPYDVENPKNGGWGTLQPFITKLRKKHPTDKGWWKKGKKGKSYPSKHWGALIPVDTYVVTDGKDTGNFGYIKGPKTMTRDGEMMDLTCRVCKTDWKRTPRQSAANYNNKCPKCGAVGQFTETGPHKQSYNVLRFPVATTGSGQGHTVAFVELTGKAANQFSGKIKPGTKIKMQAYGKASRCYRKIGKQWKPYNCLLLTLGSAAYNRQNTKAGSIQIVP